MTDDITRRIAQLQHEIADRQAQLVVLEAAQQGPWPKACTLMAYFSTMTLCEEALRLGLAGEAFWTFLTPWRDGCPIALEVREDGTSTLLTCQGQAIEGPSLPADNPRTLVEEP